MLLQVQLNTHPLALEIHALTPSAAADAGIQHRHHALPAAQVNQGQWLNQTVK
jgi:hypothetical protein